MSRTHHHHAQGTVFLGRDPADHRRQHNRRHRARCKHLVRIGRYDIIPPLKQKHGYYW
jgi:hypothetical protein